MRTYRQWLDYRELELISTFQELEPKRKRRTVLSVIKGIGNFLLAALVKGEQLQVWQTVDPDGNFCWNGYDPKTRQSIYLVTEEELRVWIDDFSRRQTRHTHSYRSLLTSN